MKRSLLGLAVLACLSFAAGAIATVRDFAVEVYATVKAVVFDGFAIVARVGAESNGPVRELVQAKSFTQRIEKRERPVLTGSWRMCPSI